MRIPRQPSPNPLLALLGLRDQIAPGKGRIEDRRTGDIKQQIEMLRRMIVEQKIQDMRWEAGSRIGWLPQPQGYKKTLNNISADYNGFFSGDLRRRKVPTIRGGD